MPEESVNTLDESLKKGFYQSKYDYYRKINKKLAIIIVIANIMYYIMDCIAVGGYSEGTLGLRFVPVSVLLLYLFLDHKYREWQRVFFLPYIVAYICVFTTILANGITMDDGAGKVTEIFIVLQFAFIGYGLATPFKWHTGMYIGYFLIIMIANYIAGYDNFFETILISLPIAVGSLFALKAIEDAYVSLYKMKIDLWHSAITDNLTQLNNRTKIEKDLTIKDAFGEPTKKLNWDEQTTFLMLDIDHFKNINDTYGHDAGDEILRFVSKIFTNCTRLNDYVIRWGGEEFVIILKKADEKTAYNIAERIRHKVHDTENGIKRVTVSIGIAKYDGDDYEQTIENADKALYYAKEHGRNRTVLYDRIMNEMIDEEIQNNEEVTEEIIDETDNTMNQRTEDRETEA